MAQNDNQQLNQLTQYLQLQPDGQNIAQVDKLIHLVMKNGKKALARRLVFQALTHAKRSVGAPSGFMCLERALDEVQPWVDLRSVRVRRRSQQVPSMIRPSRQLGLGLRWLCQGAKQIQRQKGVSFDIALGQSIAEAARGQGWAKTQRDTHHKQAEANRASAHFRWWKV